MTTPSNLTWSNFKLTFTNTYIQLLVSTSTYTYNPIGLRGSRLGFLSSFPPILSDTLHMIGEGFRSKVDILTSLVIIALFFYSHWWVCVFWCSFLIWCWCSLFSLLLHFRSSFNSLIMFGMVSSIEFNSSFNI